MDNYSLLNDFMGGDVVSLPFAAAFFRWQRGNPQVSADLGCGAAHYGGWMADAAATEEAGIAVPEWLSLEYFTYSDGAQREVLATRVLHLAFIGRRSRWETDPQSGRRRSHVQYLAFAANYNLAAKSFEPWMPVVLTAKGLNTKHLANAITQWDRLTASVRQPSHPAWVYWCTIGTYGRDVYRLSAGQSYITPPRLICDPKKIGPEYIAARYVGSEIGKAMLEMASAAREWLDAWKSGEGGDDNDALPQQPPQPPRPPQPPQPPVDEDDSFPF